jgi:hypothetical protein
MQVKCDDSDNPIWEVEVQPFELNELFQWLNERQETRIRIRINGELYAFYSLQEIACFTFGASMVARMTQDASLLFFGEQQRAEIKASEKRIMEQLGVIRQAARELEAFAQQKEEEMRR